VPRYRSRQRTEHHHQIGGPIELAAHSLTGHSHMERHVKCSCDGARCWFLGAASWRLAGGCLLSSRWGLHAKVAAAARLPRRARGGGRGGWCRTRRHHVDRQAATLTCAGRNRSVFMRRRVPQTVYAGDRLKTVVRRMSRGSVPAKAVADASCDRGAGRSSSRSARSPRAMVMVVRRSSRPTRTRRVRGQPRWRRRCGGLCAPRGVGTVRITGLGKPRRGRPPQVGVLGDGAAARG
jgi:hypothetical protein